MLDIGHIVEVFLVRGSVGSASDIAGWSGASGAAATMAGFGVSRARQSIVPTTPEWGSLGRVRNTGERGRGGRGAI